jgi:hypothetical protein
LMSWLDWALIVIAVAIAIAFGYAASQGRE